MPPPNGVTPKRGLGVGSGVAIACLGLFVLVVLSVVVESGGKAAVADTTKAVSGQAVSSTESQPAIVPSPEPSAKPSEPATEAAPDTPWTYESSKDPMSSGTSYVAQVTSNNTVKFDFPYGGEQHATLTLREHPRFGKDVILGIERGQLLVYSYEESQVLVRFDEGPSRKFLAVGPEDNSSTSAFIKGYDRFIRSMRKSKRVRISVNVFQQGAPVFEFDVSHFEPSKFKPKSK